MAPQIAVVNVLEKTKQNPKTRFSDDFEDIQGNLDEFASALDATINAGMGHKQHIQKYGARYLALEVVLTTVAITQAGFGDLIANSISEIW